MRLVGSFHIAIVVGCTSAIMLAEGLAASAPAATLKTLHSFCSAPNVCPDGETPFNGLLIDQHDNLYGTTIEGGAHGAGTVFALFKEQGKDVWKFRVLHNFCDVANCTRNGSETGRGKLIIDVAGNIYGTAAGGGANGGGLVYRLVPNGTKWDFHPLYAFCARTGCADGELPASLTYAGAETGAPYDGVSPLYGVTEMGGAQAQGVAYALTPRQRGTWPEKVLYDFCAAAGCADGRDPALGLSLDANGNITGTAAGGNSDAGVVFQLSPSGHTWSESVLYRFCSLANCADGNTAAGGTIADTSGTLYGMTVFGGNTQCQGNLGCGVMYALTANGSQSPLHTFCSETGCADGTEPDGSLLADGAGGFYGTAQFGGQFQDGVVFHMSGNSYQVLYAFCCGGGRQPLGGVVKDANGNLFGITFFGGAQGLGTVFELTP